MAENTKEANKVIDNPKTALPILIQATKDNPGDFNTFIELGQCYFNLRKYNQAEKSAKQAIGLNPSAAEAYVLLTRIAFLQDQRKGFFEFADRAWSLAPDEFFGIIFALWPWSYSNGHTKPARNFRAGSTSFFTLPLLPAHPGPCQQVPYWPVSPCGRGGRLSRAGGRSCRRRPCRAGAGRR